MFKTQREYYKSRKDLHLKLPLFFQPWWLDAVCKNWEVILLEKEGTIQLVFPFQIEKKIGIRIIRNPLLTPYLGPFILNSEDSKINSLAFSSKILPEAFSRLPNWDYCQIEALPEFQDFFSLYQLGFSNSSKLTYYVDLNQTEKQLLYHIHPRRRNYIRKAAEVLTISQDSLPDWNLFYQWHKRVFDQKKQFYPYSISFFEKVERISKEHNSSLFLTAKNKEGTVVAMLWTPFDAEKSYHLLSAYHPENKINGAIDLLIWEAFKIAKAGGRNSYDFEGSMDSGIESFFRKFGGEPKPYFSFSQNKSILWKIKKTLIS